MTKVPTLNDTERSAATSRQHTSRPHVSIVVPVYNEVENVEPGYRELTQTLTDARLDYEIIFVDDGSRDGTLELLRRLCADDPRVTILELRRNFGQTAAMAAGFREARGDVLIPIDGDMQNDPRDIPRLLAKLDEPPGHDVVSGWRRDRKDKTLTRKVPSTIANRIIAYSTGVALHDYGCTLKAYRREVMDDVHLYSELHRFLPALAAWEGARVTELVVNHRPRTRGVTKYGLKRTFRVVLDLVTVKFLGGYMTKPLYFFGKIAAYVMLLAVMLLGVAVGQRFGLFGEEHLHLNRNILVALASLLAMLSAQCVVVGIMAELLVRVYHESQNRPTYRIRRRYECGQDTGRANANAPRK
jgi:glycosyltransferase involved in cell wall biosynthesis